MKEVKMFIIIDIFLIILKVIGGLICHSYTMIASSLLEIILLITSLFVMKRKDNKKYKGIITSILGLIIILLGLGMIFWSFVLKIEKVSLLILLFIFICIIARYIVGCYYASVNFRKKKGILGYSSINSNIDFYISGIMIVVLILSKISKWVDVLKYADRVGTILISLYIIYRGLKLITNSFKYIEEEKNDIDEYEKEIKSRTEVKKFVNIQSSFFGGIRKLKCNIVLNNSLTMIDVTSFVVTLEDYLLKISDVVQVNLLDEIKPKKAKVRSLKEDARNSRSGNSKTNTKKKNTSKKNKKR
ncbi:MAG: cation transporter [Candidatus Coprovivens sp.]